MDGKKILAIDGTLQHLVRSRKLVLVLDLDHTLLNTVMCQDLIEDSSLQNAMLLLEHDINRADKTNNTRTRSMFHLEHLELMTKLRPGLRLFLARMLEMFEIHINTMGSQQYADQMTNLLDPDRRWIRGSVTGLGVMEDGVLTAPMEKTLDGELQGLEDVCLIFDDTVSVWQSYRDNLIPCERYLFFPTSRKQFGLGGLSLLDLGQDESADKGMLSRAMTIFESIRNSYFALLDVAKYSMPSVRDVLRMQRKKVLEGVHIVFSRVFPINMDPSKHTLWSSAEDFGAMCSAELTDATTHVVATVASTHKVNLARRKKSIYIVTPHWLEASMLHWERAKEDQFLLKFDT
jgi:RNA polymerase II C-terminal domain phosphatase-like 3/4